MKECPQCKRTYADETITFCLVDGAILSAPYKDLPPTQEAPPPTVRLPHSTKPQVAETIPAQALLPAMVGSKRSRSIYIVVVLVVLLLGGLVTLFALKTRRQQIVNTSTSRPDQVQTATESQPANNKKTQPSPSPSPKASPPKIENPKLPVPATIEADPKLFPSATPSPRKSEPSTDENRVFHANEVTQKAQLLSKPKPSYTEEARKNNIVGTVVLRVVLRASGEIGDITPIQGLPYGLTERAIAAAREIKFVPAMKDGRAVSQYVQIEYYFSVY